MKILIVVRGCLLHAAFSPFSQHTLRCPWYERSHKREWNLNVKTAVVGSTHTRPACLRRVRGGAWDQISKNGDSLSRDAPRRALGSFCYIQAKQQVDFRAMCSSNRALASEVVDRGVLLPSCRCL